MSDASNDGTARCPASSVQSWACREEHIPSPGDYISGQETRVRLFHEVLEGKH